MGATRRQMLIEGAAPARPADAAARRQPDDPLRALDGRDRGPDRRRRARRRRQQRPVLEPGARDPRRLRDRDHGDGARPLHRGDRRAAPTRRSATSTTAGRKRLRIQTAIVVVVARSPRSCVAKARRRERASTRSRPAIRRARSRSQPWLLAQIQSLLDYVQNPDDWVFKITEPIGNFILTEAAAAAAGVPRCEAPWFVTLVGLDADRVRHLGPPAGDHDVPHARADRRPRRLGARDGHALAGARGDA